MGALVAGGDVMIGHVLKRISSPISRCRTVVAPPTEQGYGPRSIHLADGDAKPIGVRMVDDGPRLVYGRHRLCCREIARLARYRVPRARSRRPPRPDGRDR